MILVAFRSLLAQAFGPVDLFFHPLFQRRVHFLGDVVVRDSQLLFVGRPVGAVWLTEKGGNVAATEKRREKRILQLREIGGVLQSVGNDLKVPVIEKRIERCGVFTVGRVL